MIGQVVELQSAEISVQKTLGHLKVRSEDRVSRLDFDSIGALLLSAPQAVVTRSVLDECSSRDIPVLVCGSNYLPSAIVVPVQSKSDVAALIRAQVHTTRPKAKRIWQTIVQQKIAGQAVALESVGSSSGWRKLQQIVSTVKSGDPTNREAYAAKIYWRELFGDSFRRDRNAAGVNAMLNYGYAILRSAVARALAAAGFALSIGVHHSSARNPMCLVDDIMEPFRPVVDLVVRRLCDDGQIELTPDTKAELARVLVLDVKGHRGVTTLQNGVWESALSLASVLTQADIKLSFPEFIGMQHESKQSIGV